MHLSNTTSTANNSNTKTPVTVTSSCDDKICSDTEPACEEKVGYGCLGQTGDPYLCTLKM